MGELEMVQDNPSREAVIMGNAPYWSDHHAVLCSFKLARDRVDKSCQVR